MDTPITAQLSDHFTLSEMIASQTASRQGIDNTPSDEVIANLRTTCAKLEEVRAMIGQPITVSSGYRCPALNAVVGGVPDSAHVYGLAADINVAGMSPYDFGQQIINSGIVFDQLIYEFGGWVHIGLPTGDAAPRQQILSIKHGGGYTEGWNV